MPSSEKLQCLFDLWYLAKPFNSYFSQKNFKSLLLYTIVTDFLLVSQVKKFTWYV